MYKNNFIVCVKDSNGNVLRESTTGEVFLPFYSEYSIKIKNKNEYNCLASIFIDGIDILNGSFLFVKENEETEIERFFLDENIYSGKKFKFVPLNDKKVKDYSSNENGIIKIIFFREDSENKIYEKEILDKLKDLQDQYCRQKPIIIKCSPYQYNPWIQYPYPTPIPITYYYITNNMESNAQWTTITTKYYDSNSTQLPNDTCSGATVEWSKSNQFFIKKDNIIKTDLCEIIIKLKSSKKTLTVKDTKNKFCTNCGKKSKIKDNFCSKCGYKL